MDADLWKAFVDLSTSYRSNVIGTFSSFMVAVGWLISADKLSWAVDRAWLRRMFYGMPIAILGIHVVTSIWYFQKSAELAQVFREEAKVAKISVEKAKALVEHSQRAFGTLLDCYGIPLT